MPYYFRLWNTPEFVHQLDLAPKAKDKAVWAYATEHNLTIITKDSDFTDRMLLQEPPPRVIHFRIGNVSIKEFYQIMTASWKDAKALNLSHKLVSVYRDRLEAIN